ncbi:MAG: hypothetical protein ACLGXA_05215 [Acidobacteriota bacterium]
MRIGAILVMLWLVTPPASPACRSGAIVLDPGLHRAWRLERDCQHPERPARLRETPWFAAAQRRETESARTRSLPPVIAAGMRVEVRWQDANSRGQLSGTALSTARVGERVWVRTGLGGHLLDGIARGPGWMELKGAKEER